MIMYLHLLVFFLASVRWESDAQTCNTTTYAIAYQDLYEYLGLDKDDTQTTRKRPMMSTSTYSRLNVNLFVTSIIAVQEKAQSISMQVKLIVGWKDLNVKWNRTEFCGIQTFAAPKYLFWTPDIGIVESINTEFGTKEGLYVQLLYNGYIFSTEVLAVTTACKMDLYKFPFDIQTCNITLQSLAYTDRELKMFPISDADGITNDSKELIEGQGEWELLSINMSRAKTIDIVYLMDQLVYQITIKRRPLLYVINFMLPVFFFLVLDVISIFIDANGADKLNFKVTLLLSISVLLLILNDMLPSTADKIPLIGIYCSVVFSLIGISILETILVHFLMTKGAKRRSAVLVETTAAVTGQVDGVGDLQIPPDSVRDQNEIQRSLCWSTVARVIDVIFLILYIITIIVFLYILGKLWLPN